MKQDPPVRARAVDADARAKDSAVGSEPTEAAGRVAGGFVVYRPLILLGVCAAAAVVLLAVLLQLSLRSAVAQDVGNAAQLLASMTAGVACYRAFRRGGAEARGWALLAVGAFLWTAAAALWAFYGLTRDHVYPYPSVADIGFIGYVIPVAAGLLAFPRDASRGVSRVRATLDGLLVSTAVLFVSGVTVLGPVVTAEVPALTKLVGIAYPIADVAIASLVLVLGLRQRAGRRLLWVVLGSGLVVNAITDSVYVALTNAGEQVMGTPIQAGWTAAFLLMALAAVVPSNSALCVSRPHFNVVQELVVYVPFLLAILIVALGVDPVRLAEPMLAGLGVVLLCVLVVHQVLVAVEKITLAADLEATVMLRGRQLAEVEERFGSLVESSAEAIVGKTIDGVVTSWNPAAERLYGYRAEEIVGRPATVLVPPDRLDEEAAILAAGASGERQRYETERVRKDGEAVSVSLTVSPILLGNQVQGVSVIGHDITERKRNEDALLTQQLRTRAIIDTASDPFIAMDEAGLITDWNRAAEQTFGWSRQEAVGRRVSETVIPPRYRQAHEEGRGRVVAGGEPHVLGKRVEIAALHRNGNELQVELSSWRAEGEGGGFNAFLRDVTERQRVDRELVEARDQALDAARAKSEFLATMSHEIRTPMNGVIGLCGLLLDTPLDDMQRRYALGVRGSGEALLAIIDDILDFSKLEAGKVELEQVPFDPRQVVEEVGLLLASAACEQGLEMVAYCAPDMPAALRGDPGRLRQILLNLGSNAVKFTATGEVVLNACLVGGVDGQDPAIRFSVTDTGIGIDPDTQSRLFQPFSQADASTTRRFGGTGLGLVICQRLVQAMGGSIDLDSAAGRGSTFSFTLRLPACPRAPAPEPMRPELLRGLRVLVVDDNDTNRTVLATQLAAWDIAATVTADARTGLQLLHAAVNRAEPYAVAVLDLCMPDMDGLALATAIASDPALSGTQTMVLTSGGGLDPERARAAGVRRWANKPVRSSELHDALMELAAPPSSAADRPDLPGQALIPQPRQSRGRVLVVEDNEVNQLVAQGVLRKLGFSCELAANGRQALAALTSSDFDVVLMDCHMPVMDGFQATAELRRREQNSQQQGRRPGARRRTPVIAMTAGVLTQDRERCRAAGMDDFVGKPVDVDALEQALTRQLTGEPIIDPAHGDPPDEAAAHEALDLQRLAVLGQLDPDGTAGLVSSIVQAFLAEAAGRMTAVREAADAHSHPALEQAAHQLKGSAGNLGAAGVVAVCDQLEALARSQSDPDAGVIERLQIELDLATSALALVPGSS